MNIKKLPHIVIVGAGFGGMEVARRLKNAPVQITLIDRHNYHLFQPLLYQVATSVLPPTEIATPIRNLLRHQHNVTVLMGEVIGVEPGVLAGALVTPLVFLPDDDAPLVGADQRSGPDGLPAAGQLIARRRSWKPVLGAWMLSIRTGTSPSLRKPCSTPGGTRTKVPGPASTGSPSRTKVSSPSRM